MKKRNRVLEVILCAALAVVVFWGYMLAARDNGVFALEDIEGDRTALNAFAFEGLAGDDNGQIYYTWQNGELKTKYYAATDDEMRYIIRQERDGSKGISRYFKKEVWSVLIIFRIQSLHHPRMPMSAGFPIWRIYRRVPENISENISMGIPYRA